MLTNTLNLVSQTPARHRVLCVAALDPRSGLSAQAARLGLTVQAQRGPDLGARMHNALSDALHGVGRAVLIGTDCPELDAAYLDAAFDALDGHDAVLGPAADGGYVLIGLRRPAPTLFTRIAWGTGTVLAETRAGLRAAGLSWRELPTLRDLDEIADLDHFPALAALAGMEADAAAEVDCTRPPCRRTPT